MDLKSIFYNQKKMRAGWRLLFFIGLLTVFSSFFLSIILGIVGIDRTSLENPTNLQTLLLSSYIVLPLLLVTWFMTKAVEHRPFTSIGIFFNKNTLWELSWGVLIGILMITLFFLITYGLGLIEIQGVLSLQKFGQKILLLLITILLAAASEEFLFRGYPFQVLTEGIGVYPTLFLTAFIFGSFHRMNPHVSTLGLINDGLAGILLGVAYIKVKSLWLPLGIHFSWNFFQGFIYSFPVSGLEFEPRLFQINMKDPAFLSGGRFGPEGSIITTVIICASIGGLVLWKGLKPTDRMSKLWGENIYPALRGDKDEKSFSDW